MTEYFQSQEEGAGQADDDDDDDYDDDDPDYDPESQNDDPSAHAPHTRSLFGGGRRLGDTQTDSQPIPAASTSAKSKKTATQQKKFATLGDFSASNGAGEGEDENDDDKQNLFAGGEKSGLAVKNPDDLKKRILEKAMKRQKQHSDEPNPTQSHFTGVARTLGGDDTPSREIVPAESRESRPQRVDRTLHFWNDGFSIDDGDLYTTNDPRNAEILNGIRQGRAPLHIMGVMPGQEVDVEIKQHQENYVRPPKKFIPFSGQGNRLGSPTPGLSSMPGSFITEPTVSAAPSPSTTSYQVNDNKPTLTLRVSLADGTRLTSRFNTDHTIGDVYAFVQQADSTGRVFVLQTTFPTKVLDDQELILGEMADFKRGGVVVQKYI
jgi:UBX domain-containing protein 1